jgi:CubicO group peptidase (beta-lactamase class C family)
MGMKNVLWGALAVGIAGVAVAQTPPMPDAAATDPAKLGWMQGVPPAPDKQIQQADLSFFTFPKTRWSFSHWRNLFPTAAIARGTSAVSPLPRRERKDIDALEFTPIGKSAPMTWAQSLGANYTDGIVVLHKGVIVYERYFGALTPEKPHIAMSVSKSFIGTLATMLAAQGKLDMDALVTRYVPELKDSGFGDATVRQVADMTTAIRFTESYTDPSSDIFRHGLAGAVGPRPADYKGPEGLAAFAMTVPKEGTHGERFKYRSVNTDVLAWIVARAAGQSVPDLLSSVLWRPMGMEQDGYIQVDRLGTPWASGGLATSLRDLARFGEMVPAAAIAAIRTGGDPAKFDKAAYPTLPGWSYHDQWWHSHNGHGAFMARGVHGQAIYIDPKAQMVIARYASHYIAGNVGIDPNSIPAYEALAAHLIAHPREKR